MNYLEQLATYKESFKSGTEQNSRPQETFFETAMIIFWRRLKNVIEVGLLDILSIFVYDSRLQNNFIIVITIVIII